MNPRLTQLLASDHHGTLLRDAGPSAAPTSRTGRERRGIRWSFRRALRPRLGAKEQAGRIYELRRT